MYSVGAAAGGSPGGIAGDMMPVVVLPGVGSGLLPCPSVPAVGGSGAVGCCSICTSSSPGGARRSVRRMNVVVPVHEWRRQGVANHLGARCDSFVVGLV